MGLNVGAWWYFPGNKFRDFFTESLGLWLYHSFWGLVSALPFLVKEHGGQGLLDAIVATCIMRVAHVIISAAHSVYTPTGRRVQKENKGAIWKWDVVITGLISIAFFFLNLSNVQ
jgi:hypothetical protein